MAVVSAGVHMFRFCLVAILAFLPWTVFPRAGVYVLAYHSFRGIAADSDIRPEVFESQIRKIRDLGYRFVSWEDIVSNRITGTTNVLVTIDDGNISLRQVFDSVLVANGVKPVLFIYPAITGRVRFSVTFADLKYYISRGATVGAHGYNHLFVNENLYRSDPAAFRREIHLSRKVLEKKLETPVQIFCYPFGVHSPRALAELKTAGYHYAFTLVGNRLAWPIASDQDPLLLPRFYVTKSSWSWIFRTLKRNTTDNSALRKKTGHAAG